MPDAANSGRRAGWLPWALLPPVSAWLAMTVLRESPLFWRNAGGYPVALRELVLDLYYPATGLLLLSCGLGVVHTFCVTANWRRGTATGWLLVAAAVGFGLAYAGANNLTNLLDGRPLHYHSPLR